MNRTWEIHVDRDGSTVPCGTLWTRSGSRTSASFEYAATWLQRPDGFSLDPELPLAGGSFHTPRPLFRAFEDPAPDRWGQTLLRRLEVARARAAGRAPRTLGHVDFLVGVDDATRLGALRIREAGKPDAPFLAASARPIPPLLALPRLLQASRRVAADDERDEDLELLLAPGTSLGGARPKATVRGPDGLLLAKFPRRDDDWPVTSWEATALALAREAGVSVSAFRLERIAKLPVLLTARFDRDVGARIPFCSAMTAVAADDGDARSYLDLAYVLRREGARPAADLAELWRRMVFNVLISNTDDHLRNHGFLRLLSGWTLAPAYDLNPMPTDVRARVHALALDDADTRASLDTVRRVAPDFGLSLATATQVIREVAKAVRRWREVAVSYGLSRRDLDRMASAFEHDDLAAAGR